VKEKSKVENRKSKMNTKPQRKENNKIRRGVAGRHPSLEERSGVSWKIESKTANTD